MSEPDDREKLENAEQPGDAETKGQADPEPGTNAPELTDEQLAAIAGGAGGIPIKDPSGDR